MAIGDEGRLSEKLILAVMTFLLGLHLVLLAVVAWGIYVARGSSLIASVGFAAAICFAGDIVAFVIRSLRRQHCMCDG